MAARSERLRQRCRPRRRYRPADDAELMAVDSDAGHTRTPDSRVRTDQTQPTDRPLPTKRPVGLQGRVATHYRDPQPPQALATQPGDRHRIAGETQAPKPPIPATRDHADPPPLE